MDEESKRQILLYEYKCALESARSHGMRYPELKKENRKLWDKVEELKNKLGEEEFN